MKKLLVSIGILSLGIELFAQQEAQFTHYMYNTLAINPAYAGSKGTLNITGLHRSQWVGLEGAPTTQTFFVHSPVTIKGEEIGTGLSIVNDKVGPINQTNFYGDFAYELNVNEAGHKLAFGLKAGLNLLQGNISQLTTTDPGDQSLSQNIETTFSPNFGFGAFYHTEKWYAGASVPRLLQSKIRTATASEETVQKRHYFLVGGMVVDIDENIKLKPSLMTKMTNAAPLSFDITVQGMYKEKFWLGTMYRFQDAVGAMLGYRFAEKLNVGYAYDFNISQLRRYNGGTHEVFVSYDIHLKEKQVEAPSYF